MQGGNDAAARADRHAGSGWASDPRVRLHRPGGAVRAASARTRANCRAGEHHGSGTHLFGIQGRPRRAARRDRPGPESNRGERMKRGMKEEKRKSGPKPLQQVRPEPTEIATAGGKLGVLLAGMGAVATTFIAGVEAVRRGSAKPFGSVTQMGTIRLGGRPEKRVPRIMDFVPLADLDQLVFGGWVIFPDTVYESAATAGVLERAQIDGLRDFLDGIKPMKGAFDQRYVKKLNGTYVIESK